MSSARVFYMKPRAYDYIRLVLGLFPYQLFLASAAVRAVVREMLGRRGWEKTAHTGAHRPAIGTGTGVRRNRSRCSGGGPAPRERQLEPALTMVAEHR